MATHVLAALACIHAAGLVHRDIKPMNIMAQAQPDGSTLFKVVDFGLAVAGEQANCSDTMHTVRMRAGHCQRVPALCSCSAIEGGGRCRFRHSSSNSGSTDDRASRLQAPLRLPSPATGFRPDVRR